MRNALLLACSLSMLGASTAHAGEVTIKPGHFKFGGVKYFRGKAENVRLGSFGEKKTPITGINYLSIEHTLTGSNVAKLRPRVATVASINWAKYSRRDVEIGGSLRYFKRGGSAAVTGSHASARKANLKLVKIIVNEGPLKNVLNSTASNTRKYLKKEGRDGRIVHEVWVVMEAQLANHFASAGSLSVRASGSSGGVQLRARAKVSARRYKTESITISAGTTFAYMLMKVKKWNRGKSRILDMEDDNWGLN